MKIVQRNLIFITSMIFLPSVCGASPAFDEKRCSELVRGCLSRPTVSRDLCFQSVAAQPLCIGSVVGEIASKRAQLSPMAPEFEEEGPSFLGPKVSGDRKCLDTFDIQFGQSLDLGEISPERKGALIDEIERCITYAPSELYRP